MLNRALAFPITSVVKGGRSMNKQILTIEEIMDIVKPLAKKYHISEVYIFGSYARGEADGESDVDVFVIGGNQFDLCNIFAFAEELRYAFQKDVDAFEIHEVNIESDFYKSVMRDRVRIA